MQFRFHRRALAAAVAAAFIAAPFGAKADQFINILTGGTSGVYYPLGVALAKIYGQKIKGVRTQVQATKASVENLNLLQQGKGELALSLGDSVKLAWEGNKDAGFRQKLDKLRGVAAMIVAGGLGCCNGARGGLRRSAASAGGTPRSCRRTHSVCQRATLSHP